MINEEQEKLNQVGSDKPPSADKPKEQLSIEELRRQRWELYCKVRTEVIGCPPEDDSIDISKPKIKSRD